MAKQMQMDDIRLADMRAKTNNFLDSNYAGRKALCDLPPIRTRYEAYGKLSEGVVMVGTAMDAVRAGMKNCLNALVADDVVFQQGADDVFAGLQDLMATTAEMAVQTLNVISYIAEALGNIKTPMQDMIEEADEDLPETEEEEEDGN